jgi:[protein-PII] uridylyltransferase
MQSSAVNLKAEAIKTSSHLIPPQTMLSQLKASPPVGICSDEIDAHFRGMPSRYWERVTTPELVWGLEVVHKFLERVAEPASPGTTPVLDWKHFPEFGFTKVMLCTWDRQGLLAKAASAFSAVRVNILNAEAYTRADQIVLDVFRVCDSQHRPVTKVQTLEQMLFVLEGSLSDPPRFASFWAASAHKREARKAPEILNIVFDNAEPTRHTALRIETDDRIGLLSDILEALAASGVNVDQALIETAEYIACDTFYIYDQAGEKILDNARLARIREALAEGIRN